MSDTHNTAPTQGNSLVRGAAVMAVTAAATLLAPQKARALGLTFNDSIPGRGDVKLLNYALALEDFEAAFYARALTKLTALGSKQGDVLFDTITKFSQVETDHATYLRATITAAKATPIGHFTYDYTRIDTAATPRDVLEVILQLEATGVRAYLGAVPLFATGSPYLQTAAAIQGTEARHTTVLTIVRNVLYTTSTPVASLTQDGNEAIKFNYDSIGYSAAKPNEGYKSIDVALSPNAVLNAIGSFFLAPA